MNPIGVVAASIALVLVAWGGIQTVRLNDAKQELEDLHSRYAARTIELASCSSALDEVNEEADRRILEASQRAARGEAAAARARVAAEAAEAARESAREALRDARRDPTCLDQLEIELCPAIPLL